MTVRYNFDLYPRTDPRDGSLIARLSDLQRAEYRGEANGSGSGLLALRGDSSDGQLIDPAGLQYVRVVSDDTDKVVGGFFLDKGDFAAITKQNTRLLTFGGAGALSYLDREVMWSHSYVDPGAMDPFDGTWRLYAQGDWAGGDYLGAVLYRVIWEAQSFASGAYTHRHKDGLTYTDTHDDDRTESAIPDLVMTFDGFEDSDGNPWTLPSGEFTAQVSESVYQVVQRLMTAGLYVEMDPDTFELSAWEATGHRRDRTGTAYGASVVRFSAGDNIKSDAKRKISAFIKRTAILATTTSDLGAVATGSGDVPWHGGIREDVNDVDALEQLATSQLARRSDAGDVLKLRMRLGASPTTGFYRPWEEVLPDDLVTVDSGSGQWDWDEAEFPVAALEVKLREEGDWDAFVEMGASFSDPSRQFQAVPVAAHHHGPNPMLCTALTPGTETVERLYLTDTVATPRAVAAGWTTSAGGTFALTLTATSTTLAAVSTWDGVNVAASTHELVQGTITLSNAGLLALVQSGGTFRIQTRIGIRHGIGINEGSQREYLEGTFRVYRPGTSSYVGTMFAVGDATGLVYANTDTAGTIGNRSMFGSYTGVAGAVSTDQLVWEAGTKHVAPTSGGTGGRLYWNDAAGSDLPEDDSTLTDLNTWIELRATTGATGTGLHPDLVGTDTTASRCDHRHHILSNRNPTSDDDIDSGYPTTTLWTNTETGQTFLLLDEDTGEWVEFGAPGEHTHDASDITGLSASGLPWFVVTDYGAVGDGSTNDTAAVNLAIAALNTAGRGVLYFPAGEYLCSSGLTTITAACIIRGDGGTTWDAAASSSTVLCSSATAFLFTIDSGRAKFENLALSNTNGSESAGAGIFVTGTDELCRVDYDSVTVDGFYVGIDSQSGTAWVMDSCMLRSQVLYSVKVSNVNNGDYGDWCISNCGFWGNGGSSAAIRVESSGGGKIINCKINQNGGTRYVNGIDVAMSGSVQTVILLVSNNSIENVSGHAISVTSATGSSFYRFMTFTGNQVGLYTNNSGKAISLVSTDAGDLSDIVISGNVFHTNGTARSAVQITNVDNITFVGNVLSDNFTSLYSTSGSTNVTEVGGSSSIDLDDLTDVVITAPAEDEQLQYISGTWVNNSRRWEPVTTNPGGGPEVVFDGSDNIVMTWETY